MLCRFIWRSVHASFSYFEDSVLVYRNYWYTDTLACGVKFQCRENLKLPVFYRSWYKWYKPQMMYMYNVQFFD